MAARGGDGEPSSAPEPGRWYPLRLGGSFKDGSASKFSTLRYDFKPASIDTTQAGYLHKSKENRVTVELHNNQPGKPKATFEGNSEDYRDSDGVLFFDGVKFRLERLYRMKRLRYAYAPGEPAATANLGSATSTGPAVDSLSPPLGKVTKVQTGTKGAMHSIPVEVERIDVGLQDCSGGPKSTSKFSSQPFSPPDVSPVPPDPQPYEQDENFDILGDYNAFSPDKTTLRQPTNVLGFDMNIPNHVDLGDDDVDVDVNDETDAGLSALEALNAQGNSEVQKQERQETSSSSGSSGSSSSGSGSGSGSGTSSSDSSDGSEADSASSAGDIDI